jgi:hypothetical protein
VTDEDGAAADENGPKATKAPSGSELRPDLDTDADRLRGAAKALLATAGAVAAVVFAGLTVADVGQLDPGEGARFWIGISGAVVAVASVVIALVTTMHLAGASTTTLAELLHEPDDRDLPSGPDQDLAVARNRIAASPLLASWPVDGGGPDAPTGLDAFAEELATASQAYVAERRRVKDDPRRDRAQLRARAAWYQQLVRFSNAILKEASFLRLQAAFGRAGPTLGAALFFTAVGAAAFAWASTAEPDGVETEAVTALLSPDEEVSADIVRQVGDDDACAPKPEMAVLVVSEGDDESDVVTVPPGSCAAARVTAPNDQLELPTQLAAPTEQVEVDPAAVEATLVPTGDLAESLTVALGETCLPDAGGIPVIVTAREDDTVEFVTVPADGCPPVLGSAPASQVRR